MRFARIKIWFDILTKLFYFIVQVFCSFALIFTLGYITTLHLKY